MMNSHVKRYDELERESGQPENMTQVEEQEWERHHANYVCQAWIC